MTLSTEPPSPELPQPARGHACVESRPFAGLFSSGCAAVVGAIAMLLVVGHLSAPPWAAGQRQSPEVSIESTGDALWLSLTHRDSDTQQLLVAVDRETRHAAVYHVDALNGTLTLRSTRNLSWDLLVDDFNGREPSPEALKNMLETGSTLR